MRPTRSHSRPSRRNSVKLVTLHTSEPMSKSCSSNRTPPSSHRHPRQQQVDPCRRSGNGGWESEKSDHASSGGSTWPPLGGSIWLTLPGSVRVTLGGSACPTPVAQYGATADTPDARVGLEQARVLLRDVLSVGGINALHPRSPTACARPPAVHPHLRTLDSRWSRRQSRGAR